MRNKKVKPSAVMKGMRFYTVEDLAEILPLTKLGSGITSGKIKFRLSR